MFQTIRRTKRLLTIAALGTTLGASAVAVAVAPAPAVSPQVGPYCFTSGNITGAGATFQINAQATFKTNYEARCNQLLRTPGTVTYTGGGSGSGRTQFCAGTVNYAASDEPMTAAAKASCEASRGGEVNHFPVTVGAVAVVYEAPTGCTVPDPLVLSGAQVADIFDGDTTNWNQLPQTPTCNATVTRVVRSDSSGTTYAFKDYLHKAEPGQSPSWKSYANTAWPPGSNTPVAAPGNGGVSTTVNGTPGAFGYVELSVAKANGNSRAHVANSTDDTLGLGTGQNPEAPDGSANCATSANTAVLPQSNGNWEDVSITYGPTGHPICTFSYMLVWTDGTATLNGSPAGELTMSPVQEQTVADLVHIANDPKTQADLAAIGYGQLPPDARAVNHAGMLQLK